MRDWISFWDSHHSIYVNARHFDVHYRTIADMIVRHLPSPDAVVLDFGCGEALHADRVAALIRRDNVWTSELHRRLPRWPTAPSTSW